MKTLGWIMLVVVAFWAGRLAVRPEIKEVIIRPPAERIYSPPVGMEVVCRTLYPSPICKRCDD